MRSWDFWIGNPGSMNNTCLLYTSYVRQGAMSYLKQQYKVVGLVFLGLVIWGRKGLQDRVLVHPGSRVRSADDGWGGTVSRRDLRAGNSSDAKATPCYCRRRLKSDGRSVSRSFLGKFNNRLWYVCQLLWQINLFSGISNILPCNISIYHEICNMSGFNVPMGPVS